MGGNGFGGQGGETDQVVTRSEAGGGIRAGMGQEGFDQEALAIIQGNKLSDDNVTGQLNLASADQLLSGFDIKDPFNKSAEPRSLWEDLKKTFGFGDDLHDRVGEKVDKDWEKKDPDGFKEYERQKAEHDAQYLRSGMLPIKGRDEFPALVEHDKRTAEMEKNIQIKVLQDMPPEQRKQMGADMAKWEKAEADRMKDFNPLLMDISQGSRRTPLPESYRQYQEKVKQYTEYATI